MTAIYTHADKKKLILGCGSNVVDNIYKLQGEIKVW